MLSLKSMTFEKLFKGYEPSEILLILILSIFIVIDLDIPGAVANTLDDQYFYVLCVLACLVALFKMKSIFAVIFVVFVYFLIMRIKKGVHKHRVIMYVPSEMKKEREMRKFNEKVEHSELEENIVGNYISMESKPKTFAKNSVLPALTRGSCGGKEL